MHAPDEPGFWTVRPAPSPPPPVRGAAWLGFGLTLPLYFATMNRTIGFIDRGELAAAACTFGIAHPPGYPTLMLLGGALVRLIPVRPAVALNALAAVLVAASVAVLVLVLDRVLARLAPADVTARERARYALLGALFVAVTMTWWQQANGFEVYALHALLVPLITLLCLRWIEAQPPAAAADGAAVTAAEAPPHTENSPRPRARGFVFGLSVGLAFTNHLTTVLLAPALIAFSVSRLGGPRWWRALPAVVPGFLVGLLPYAWLPIRSAMGPRFDWGAPHTWRAFLHHVSGADYRGWMFTDAAAFDVQSRFVAWRVPWDLAWVGVIVAGLGLAVMIQRSRSFTLLAGLLVAAGLVFAAGYRIMDIESYLLTATFGFGLLVAAGMLRLHERLGALAATTLAVALVAGTAVLHLRECDESRNRLAEAHVRDQLGPLPQNALYFTTLWDFGLSASYYFQEVEGLRRDVTLVNPLLLRIGWYYDELERRAPELVGRAQPEGRVYRAALAAMESGQPYDLKRAEREFLAFINALAGRAMTDRAVVASGPTPELDARWRRVPYHLVFWLRDDDAYVPERPWHWAFQPWSSRKDVYVAMTCWHYGRARLARADYEAERNDAAATRRILATIPTFDPELDPGAVGPLPQGAQGIVEGSMRFFENVRRTLEVAERRAAARPRPPA